MDPIEEIKSKIDIVDFISQYVPLKKSGSNFRALCPFHVEKTPSFFVSPEKQIWHCFGCGRGGNIFNFLMEMEKIDFPEALQILAQKAGVSLKKYDSFSKNKKTQLYKINELAVKFYHKILKEHPKGKKALEYLEKERELPLSIIEKFQLGFAPKGFDLLLRFLKNKGFEEQDVIEAGLARRTEGGRVVDLFRERIVFPLKDQLGRVVGFSGRVLNPQDEPKYLNTPQTLIFDKSRILYGLFEGKEKIKEKKEVIVCEGQMDVLACWKAGIENAVCSSGTAFTESQLNLLKKYTQKILFAFDKDTAGEEALLRSLGLALEKDFIVKVIPIPTGKDPDEAVKKDKEAFKKATQNPLDFLDFYFVSISDKIDTSTLEGKKAVLENLFPLIAKIKNKLEQKEWLSRLAFYLKVEDKVIFDSFSVFQKKEENKKDLLLTVPENIEVYLSENPVLLEGRFLGMLLAFPSHLDHFIVRVYPEDFSQEEFSLAYKKLQELYTNSESFSLNEFLALLEPSLQEKLEQFLLGAEEFYKDFDEKKIFEEMENYMKRLKKIKFDKIKKAISLEIKEAEKQKDKKRVEELLLKLQKVLLEEKRELI